MLKVRKAEKSCFQRTECEAETLQVVENNILHPLVVKAMKNGWKKVNKGQYASRADAIDSTKVDLKTIFHVKGDIRVIAGLLDHIPGGMHEKAESLKKALVDYVQPTVNNYSYKDVTPEKMGVYIDTDRMENNKAFIIHEARCPGEYKHYCNTLKHEIEYMNFSGTPLDKKQMRAYYKLKYFILSTKKMKGMAFIESIAIHDKNLLNNRAGLNGAKSAAKEVAQMLKFLIFRNPKQIIQYVTPYKWAGLKKNKEFWLNYNTPPDGILGYILDEYNELKVQ